MWKECEICGRRAEIKHKDEIGRCPKHKNKKHKKETEPKKTGDGDPDNPKGDD